MIELNFDSITQLKIFFCLINQKKPIERNELAFNTGIPRTTIYDNLIRMYYKTVQYRHYVNKVIICNHKRGRDKVLWFVSGFIKKQFISIDICPVVKVKGIIVVSPIEI